MTVESNDILRVFYTMNGVANLPFPFPTAQERDVIAFKKNKTSGESEALVQGIDYTVQLTDYEDLPSDGEITLLDTDLINDTNYEVLITRLTEQKQPYDMHYNQEMNPEQLELEHDREVMMIQDIKQVVDEDVLRIKAVDREINTAIEVPEPGSPCDLLVMCEQGIGQIPATPEQPFINLVNVKGKLNPVHVISPTGDTYTLPVIAGNYYFLDDSNGDVILTFPPTLSVKDEFGIATLSDTRGGCYVDPNGKKLFGQISMVRWNLKNSGLFLQYVSETIGVLNQSALEGISEEPDDGGGGGGDEFDASVNYYLGFFSIQKAIGTSSMIDILDPNDTHGRAGFYVTDEAMFDIPNITNIVISETSYISLRFNVPATGTQITEYEYKLQPDEYATEEGDWDIAVPIGRVYYSDVEGRIENITQEKIGYIREDKINKYYGQFAVTDNGDNTISVFNSINDTSLYCGTINLTGSLDIDVENGENISVPDDGVWRYIQLNIVLKDDNGVIPEFEPEITIEDEEQMNKLLETHITLGAVRINSNSGLMEIQQYQRGSINTTVYGY